MPLQRYTIQFTIPELTPLPQDVAGGERQTLDAIISYCSFNNIPDIVNSKVHDVGYHRHSGSYDIEEQPEVIKSETFVTIHFEADDRNERDEDFFIFLYVQSVKSLHFPQAQIIKSDSKGQGPHQRNILEIQTFIS